MKDWPGLIEQYQVDSKSYFHGHQDDIEFLRSAGKSKDSLELYKKHVVGRKLRNGTLYWHIRRPARKSNYWQITAPIEPVMLTIWNSVKNYHSFGALLSDVIINCKDIPQIGVVTAYDLAYRTSVMAGIPLDGLYVKAGSSDGLKYFASEYGYGLKSFELKKYPPYGLWQVTKWPTPCKFLEERFFTDVAVKKDGYSHLENFLCWCKGRG